MSYCLRRKLIDRKSALSYATEALGTKSEFFDVTRTSTFSFLAWLVQGSKDENL
jgi:hypothetical protein